MGGFQSVGFSLGRGGGEKVKAFWSPCVLVQTLLLDGEALF